MKKYLFTFLFVSFTTFSFSQDSAKEIAAQPNFSQDAIKYYFKSSESSHLSSKEQNWSFSFISADKKKLQKLADELNQGQTKPKAIEHRESMFIFTLKGKNEI